MRRGYLHRASFSTRPDYLSRHERGLAGGGDWPTEYGPELSRSFRALKIWLASDWDCPLRPANRAELRPNADLGRRVDEVAELERLAPVDLNIACFRYRPQGVDPGPGLDMLNEAIVEDLQETGIAAPSTTRIRGQLAIRVNITNHRTRREDLDLLVRSVIDHGRRRTARSPKPSTKERSMAQFIIRAVAQGSSGGAPLKVVDLGECENLQVRAFANINCAWARWIGSRQLTIHENARRMLFVEGEPDRLPTAHELAAAWLPGRTGSFRGFEIAVTPGGGPACLRVFVDPLGHAADLRAQPGWRRPRGGQTVEHHRKRRGALIRSAGASRDVRARRDLLAGDDGEGNRAAFTRQDQWRLTERSSPPPRAPRMSWTHTQTRSGCPAPAR